MYSAIDLRSPIATYPLGGWCYSGVIIDDYLYLGGNNLFVFKINTSLTEPLTPTTVITTKRGVYKILRVENELLLGE